MFLLQICPPKLKWNHTTFHICHSEAGPLRVRGRRLSLGHRKVETMMKEAEQVPTVSVDYGFFWEPEDRAHDTLPVLVVRDRKTKGIWSHPVPSKGVTHPCPATALMADLDFMGCKKVIFKSGQEPSIVALSQEWLAWRDCISQGREQEQWRGRTLFNLCTDLRGPSKTFWNNDLESRWSLEVRGGLN